MDLILFDYSDQTGRYEYQLRYYTRLTCLKIQAPIGTKISLYCLETEQTLNEWILTESPFYFTPFEGKETDLPLMPYLSVFLKTNRKIKGKMFGTFYIPPEWGEIWQNGLFFRESKIGKFMMNKANFFPLSGYEHKGRGDCKCVLT